jgi:hypothetical protein
MPPLAVRISDKSLHLAVEAVRIGTLCHVTELRQQTWNLPSLVLRAWRVSAPSSVAPHCTTGAEVGVLRVWRHICVPLDLCEGREDGVLRCCSGGHFDWVVS